MHWHDHERFDINNDELLRTILEIKKEEEVGGGILFGLELCPKGKGITLVQQKIIPTS